MLERIGYTILGLLALLWVFAIVLGMVVAFPFGLIGLVGLLGIGLLVIKVLKDRLTNKEDDYYDKHVEK